MSEDSGLGRATPPRRAPSPGMARHLPSPSGPGSLPPGLFSKRKQAGFDDAASDISSTASSTADYLGKYSFCIAKEEMMYDEHEGRVGKTLICF